RAGGAGRRNGSDRVVAKLGRTGSNDASFPMSEADTNRRLQATALLAAALLLIPALGLAPLFDVDEGAFGEATRELLASGDWLSTTLNGAPRFDKPILVYWLQAASVSLL